MAHPGQELTDRDTGARLRYLETAASSGGDVVRMELAVLGGWSAGPLHVHPRQNERLRILEGLFRTRCGEERELQRGDELDVAPGTPHTIELVGETGRLEVEFTPALRTDELFETMFTARLPRRPPGFVPGALRAFVESRGFADEIRYLWPRRLVLVLAAAAIVLLGRSARNASRRAASSSSSS